MRLLIFLCCSLLASCAAVSQPNPISIEDTVVKQQLQDDVSIDDAIESMKLRANLLNMNLVAELPLSKQIKAMGKSSKHISIYQFCDPLMAKRMVEHDISYAAYLPCRISLIEDENNQAWLIMMNMDLLLNGLDLNSQLGKDATEVKEILLEIMQAGATGDL